MIYYFYAKKYEIKNVFVGNLTFSGKFNLNNSVREI